MADVLVFPTPDSDDGPPEAEPDPGSFGETYREIYRELGAIMLRLNDLAVQHGHDQIPDA